MTTAKTTKSKPTKTSTRTKKVEVKPADGEFTISVDGVPYSVDSLPEEIKERIMIYQSWESELNKAKLEVFKLEAARVGLGGEIESLIRKMGK